MSTSRYPFAHRFDQVSGSAIREIFKVIAQPGMISFAGGNPAQKPSRMISSVRLQMKFCTTMEKYFSSTALQKAMPHFVKA